jgi:hypothetical protein
MTLPAPTRRFAGTMPAPEPRATFWVRRACLVLFGIHLLFSIWDLYRRIWQILRVDVAVSATALRPGASVFTDVIATGETHNRMLLELRQGDRARVLYEERARVSTVAMYDPRVFRYQRTTRLSDEALAGFAPGPAVLRLTGFGGQKLLRTPAARVREIPVTIASAWPRDGK